MPSAALHTQVVCEVSAAHRLVRPTVARESSSISHGMPYPQNLQTALEVEAVVLSQGAVPATIAIIEGQPCIGLERDQLERIARKGLACHKVSRRDLPLVMAQGLDGATTVSATMLLASLAGIKVFVTGGVGGVHRGGESTMDISSDLTELGRTPVAVVCAGVKSVLDIPRTLEFLETQGVCVAAFNTDEFPAFFSRHSGCKAPARVDTPKGAAAMMHSISRLGLSNGMLLAVSIPEAHACQAAAMMHSISRLGLSNGMLLAVPIPEAHAAEGTQIEGAIKQALDEADDKGIKGNAVTPFLLERIRQLTGGKSLEANIRLVKNNATVGAQMACALNQLQGKLVHGSRL
eukprot:gene14411-20405_t